ncbi:MAG: LacI family DNA-binding transcriptional regulator [Bryobacteraceae bacterium]
MPVSIKDIARLAGVSHSTVSRALHKSPLIPPATAQRIQQIAQEQGYTASAVARSLVTRRTQAIGVVVTSIADPFNGDVVAGIEEVANERGYSVILATSQADPDRELAVVRSCQERRVDGILVASSRVGALYVPVLSELDVPIVLINNQHGSDFAYSIRIDNVHGMRLATEHLLALGHRRIAYVGDRFGLHSDEERFAGYASALAACQIPLDKELVANGNGKADEAGSALDQLLKRGAMPSAIACYNDMTALGLMQRAQELGISVPGELSVTGFDDIPFAAFAMPPLTTVRQPRREMGRQAMRLLFARLSDEPAEKTSVINGELIVRGSTAPQRA